MVYPEDVFGAGGARRFDWLCDNWDAHTKSERIEFNRMCDKMREAEEEEYSRRLYNHGMAECFGPDTVFDVRGGI